MSGENTVGFFGEGTVRSLCGLRPPRQTYSTDVRVVDFEALEDLSDDRLLGISVQNPYFHAFCGERTFQWPEPCASSDLTHFRKRLGKEGVEKIFKASVLLHGPQAL